MKMINMRRTLLLTLSCCMITGLFGQRIQHWQTKRDYGAFVQGVFSLDVSAPPIEMVGLYDQLDRFEYDKAQELYIQWVYPEQDYFFLKAGEKQILRYYGMESKPDSIRELRTIFGPWRVDDVMGNIYVAPNNLAVLLRVRSDFGDHYVPVNVYQGDGPVPTPYYRACFRIGRNIGSGYYKVYKGEYLGVPAENKLAQVEEVGGRDAGSTMTVYLEKERLASYRGWVTVVLSLFERDKVNNDDIEYRFYFYQH